jgi:thiamine-monophosphate kinase
MNPWIKKNKLFDIGLSGGDGYQLLFTAPKKNRDKINLVSKMPSIKLVRIGSIKKDRNLDIIDHKGMLYKLKKKGYDHFETK